jgi:hypothetical protein
MPTPRQFHRGSTRVFSVLLVVVGVAMVVSSLSAGGGPLAVGVVLGVLFAAAGGARLYLLERTPR